MKRIAALSIAGSDSGGGAGIQADLRVLSALGVLGTTAITAITAQNLEGVAGIESVSGDLVEKQIASVKEGFDVRAVKTGMLWSAEIVDATANALGDCELPLVVDPVMVATSGALLLDPAAIARYRERLFPRATVVTPNLDEAKVLLDASEPASGREIAALAETLLERVGTNVLLKGGHLEGDPIDILATSDATLAFRHERVRAANTHGSGCMLSAAICARLALGDALANAVHTALAFVHDAIARGAAGPAPHLADIENARAETSAVRCERIR